MSTAYELHERSRRHDDHDESNPLPTATAHDGQRAPGLTPSRLRM